MQQTIAVNDRRIETHVGSAPSTGPFQVDFPFFSLDDVLVTLLPDGSDTEVQLVRGPDYSLVGIATEDGSFSSGTVTLVLPVSNTTLIRSGRTPVERLSNFPLQGWFSRLALNAELNRITVWMQENRRTLEGLVGDVDAIDPANFLPLTGGTLTGPLYGTNGTFTDQLAGNILLGNIVTVTGALTVQPGGTANAPTPPLTDVSTKLATTAFVRSMFATRNQGQAIYEFGGTTASGDPGAGIVVIDPGTAPLRHIAVSKTDADAVERLIDALSPGDTVIFTNETAPTTDYARYNVISTPVDHGTWVEFDANLVDSFGNIEGVALGTRLRLTGFFATSIVGGITGVSAGYGLLHDGSNPDIPELSIDPAIVAEIADISTALTGYLPLTGGTLTGGLTGTTGNFSSLLTGSNLRVSDGGLVHTPFNALVDTGTTRAGFRMNGVAGTIDVITNDIDRGQVDISGTLLWKGRVHIQSDDAPPAGGTLGVGLMMGSTPNFGVMFGADPPNKAAPVGTLYLRTNGFGETYRNSDGTSVGWVQAGGGGSAVHVGVSGPATPVDGQLWWQTELGQMFIYYNDGNTTQWVPAAPAASMAVVVARKVTRYTANGSWTPDPKMVFGEARAKGGGGGALTLTADPAYACNGSGGGEGATAIKYFKAGDYSGAQTVTIGAGGGASINGASSSIGTWLIASGGNAGGAGGPTGIEGGLGGQTGTGDEVIPGAPGGVGSFITTGNSPFAVGASGGGSGGGKGFGTAAIGGAGIGTAGTSNSGGGGGGSASKSAGPGGVGGAAGGSGYVTVIEYLRS